MPYRAMTTTPIEAADDLGGHRRVTVEDGVRAGDRLAHLLDRGCVRSEAELVAGIGQQPPFLLEIGEDVIGDRDERHRCSFQPLA